jgi:hypothetical protein
MFVSSILREAKGILGTCDDATAFRRLTDAVRLANNQAKANDWNVGQMDICISNNCITLPADVGTVLASNTDGQPVLLRDQWFQFHVNGPGASGWAPWGYVDELGPVCTFRDPTEPMQLYAVAEHASDVQKQLQAYGWDLNGKPIYTPSTEAATSGIPYFGFATALQSATAPAPAADAPYFAKIDRIQKPETAGFVRLYGVTAAGTHVLLGTYLPWETVPSYRRVRVPGGSWIRIRYRKRDLEVRGESDWINLENRQALLLLLKSVKLRLTDGQIEQARAYEAEGIRLLSDEAEANKPPALSAPQVIWADGPSTSGDTLFY